MDVIHPITPFGAAEEDKKSGSAQKSASRPMHSSISASKGRSHAMLRQRRILLQCHRAATVAGRCCGCCRRQGWTRCLHASGERLFGSPAPHHVPLAVVSFLRTAVCASERGCETVIDSLVAVLKSARLLRQLGLIVTVNIINPFTGGSEDFEA